MAFLVLRDSIYFGFNNVLTEDVRSPRLSDEMMLEVLQFTAEGSVLAETLYHCISYIPAFYRATWATRAEALAHERRIQLYLRRLITILGALLKVSLELEEGIADRWNFGACDGWSCYDFLEAVSPGFVQLEAERRGLSISALRQTYGWHYDEDSPLFFWDYERWESNGSEDGDAWSTQNEPAETTDQFYEDSDDELEVLAEWSPDTERHSDLEAVETMIFDEKELEDHTDSWQHVASVEDLAYLTAIERSIEDEEATALGLVTQFNYFLRLDDNTAATWSTSRSGKTMKGTFQTSLTDALVLSLNPFTRRNPDDDSDAARYRNQPFLLA
ncbi:hypothetical protein BDZ89DRAFT_1082026 [Hymenopellis radicata]|nr:hypothetical protein BDZ89DRAFT_1082026 [Hymenopellis radicata]